MNKNLFYFGIFALLSVSISSCGSATALKEAEKKAAFDRQLDSMSTSLSKSILDQAKSQLLTASTLLEVAKNSEAIRAAIREELNSTNTDQEKKLNGALMASSNMAVFFALSSTELSADARQELYIWWLNVSSKAGKNANLKVSLTGFTDRRYTSDYNTKLAKGRAESVKKWLLDFTTLTVDQIKIEEVSPEYSKDFMIDRRVEVHVAW